MDLMLKEIFTNDNGEVITNESGDILCRVCDSHGESKEIYLTQEQIRKLSKKIGEAPSSESGTDTDEPLNENGTTEAMESTNQGNHEIDTHASPNSSNMELIKAMSDIRRKAENKANERFNKVFNLMENIYKQTHPYNRFSGKKSDSDSKSD